MQGGFFVFVNYIKIVKGPYCLGRSERAGCVCPQQKIFLLFCQQPPDQPDYPMRRRDFNTWVCYCFARQTWAGCLLMGCADGWQSETKCWLPVFMATPKLQFRK